MKAILRFLFIVPILLSTFLIAQTGPGGVGDNSTVLVWLDASQLGLNNNDPVSSWTDLSTNGNTPTQGTGASQPTFKSTGFNGKPGVQFDGTDDFMLFPNNLPATEQSIFMVNKRQGSYKYRYGYTCAKFNLMTMISGNLWGYYVYNNFQSGGYQNAGDLRILSTIVSDPSSSLLLGQDNNYQTKTYTSTGNRPNATLGCNNNTLKHYHQGVIPEFIVYNTVLNNPQRVIVNNYLGAKYNFTISNSRYAFKSTHGNEVAGIGGGGGETHTDARGTSDVQINNATSINNGDYLLWGHDDGNYNANFTDLPIGFNGARWNKLWRIDERNSIGNYDVRIHINANGIGNDDNQYYLVYDQNDGVFNNGSSTAIGPGVYDVLTNSVLFTNVNIPDNSWFTLANADADIVSTKTDDWNDPTTWTCNCIPDSTVDVTILNTHNVSVTAYQSINNLTVDPGGTLTLSGSNTLSIKGNYDNSGSLAANTGNMSFSGTTTQTITNQTSRIDFYDYTQSNPTTVQLNSGSIGIINTLNMNAGALNNVALGNIVLLANATTMARISQVAGGSSFSGNFVMERFIGTRAANWSNISSPMSSMNFNVLDQDLYFSGINGNDGNAGPPGNLFYSAYYYIPGTQAYDSITSTSRVLNPGEGFEIWLADDQTTFNAATVDAKGVPTVGSVSANSFLPSGSGEWGLIGNPYASWIDWSSVTKTGLPNEVWIFDAGSGNYQQHNTGNVPVPPMQGFWVQASAASPTATFTESAKSTTNTSTFFRQASLEDEFRLILTENNTGYNQTARLKFNNTTDLTYDLGVDVTLLVSKNELAPNLTSISSDGKKLMVNYFNTYHNEVIVPLYVSLKQEGLISLIPDNVDYLLSEYQSVVLLDKQTNIIYDISDGGSIDMFLLAGDYDDRFQLRLSNELQNTQDYAVNDLVYYTKNSNSVTVKLDDFYGENFNIEVYDITGKQVKSLTSNKAITHFSLPTNSSNGTYIVKLISNKSSKSHKIIVY